MLACGSPEPVAIDLPPASRTTPTPSPARAPLHAPFPEGAAPAGALDPHVASIATAVHLTAVQGAAGLLGQHESTFECALAPSGARCDVYCRGLAASARATTTFEAATVSRWLDDLARLPLGGDLPAPSPTPLDAYAWRSIEVRTPTAVIALESRASAGETWRIGIIGVGALRVPGETPERVVREIVESAGDPCASALPRPSPP